jgi:hypothetical protein
MPYSTFTITRPALLHRLVANLHDALPGLSEIVVTVWPDGEVKIQPVNDRDEADVADVDRIAAYLGLDQAKILETDTTPHYGTKGVSAGVRFRVVTVLATIPAVAS